MTPAPDERLSSQAADRNKGPILEVLRRVLPASGVVLEIASGSGQHAVHFARGLPHLIFQPSDPDQHARRSIDAWAAAERLPNLLPAVELDVRSEPWPVSRCNAIVCINMIHISPWAATTALFSGAARALPADGVVYLYGPYRVGGVPTAPSNAAFDRALRSQNPEWGLRDLEAVLAAAAAEAFEHVETAAMPANNLSVVLRKR